MKQLFLAMPLFVALASQAHSATIATPPMAAGSQETLRCMISNAGTRSVVVERMEVIDPTATSRLLRAGVELRPDGALISSVSPSSLGFNGLNAWFCRAVVRGSTKALELTLCSGSGDGLPCDSSVTSP